MTQPRLAAFLVMRATAVVLAVLIDEQAPVARSRRLLHAVLAGTVALLLAVGTAALTVAAAR
jgi:hypothetical protein